MTTRLRKFINLIAISPDNRDTPSPGIAPSVVGSGGRFSPDSHMSTTDSVDAFDCGRCGDRRPKYDLIEGSYCSQACYFRDRGENALARLHSDHRICSTCYGLVKDVEPVGKRLFTPGPDHSNRTDTGPREIQDGFQYATDRTTWGVDDWGVQPYMHVEGTRWSCVCGAVNPQHKFDEIQAIDLGEAIRNLWYALRDAFERGAIQNEPRKEPFLEAFRPPWGGAEYAVGRALFTDP